MRLTLSRGIWGLTYRNCDKIELGVEKRGRPIDTGGERENPAICISLRHDPLFYGRLKEHLHQKARRAKWITVMDRSRLIGLDYGGDPSRRYRDR